MSRIIKYVVMICVIVISDQLSKGIIQGHFVAGESLPVINGFFNITYIQNPGAAFGFMARASSLWRSILFLFVPVLVSLWLCWLIWKVRKISIIQGFSYSLILAGAVGNLIDRFSMGFVVDFLDFHIQTNHFPAFNIADSSISIAAALLILDLILGIKKSKVMDIK